MKKNRPGVLLSVLAAEAALPALESVLFRETETFGVRRYPARRSKLRREAVTVETPWGPVRGKRGWREGGPNVFTPEYEDCAGGPNAGCAAARGVRGSAEGLCRKE